MPLEVRPALPGDAANAVKIRTAANAADPSDRVFYPGGPSPEMLRVVIQRLADELNGNSADGTSGTRAFKVVDVDGDEGHGGGNMVAFGQWTIEMPTPATASLPKPVTDDNDPDRFGPGSNLEACALVFDRLRERSAALIGNAPRIDLDILHTEPNHQGRGAGTMLVQRCLEDAERLGLPVWVTSSAKGHSIYLKSGFKASEEHTADLSRWGATDLHRNWLMVKEYNGLVD